jgi:hypothetical protein
MKFVLRPISWASRWASRWGELFVATGATVTKQMSKRRGDARPLACIETTNNRSFPPSYLRLALVLVIRAVGYARRRLLRQTSQAQLSHFLQVGVGRLLQISEQEHSLPWIPVHSTADASLGSAVPLYHRTRCLPETGEAATFSKSKTFVLWLF